MTANYVLCQLPELAESLLRAEGSARAPLSTWQLSDINERLAAILDVFCADIGVLLKVLGDDAMRTALIQVVAVAVRCPTVLEDDGASCILRQLQAQALYVIQALFRWIVSQRRGPQPMDDVVEFVQGLLRTQLLQCASQHLTATSQCLRGVLASSCPRRVTPGSANSGGDLDAGRGTGWPTVLTAIDIVFGFTRVILPLIGTVVRTEDPACRMLPFVEALAAALLDSAIMEHMALGLTLTAQLVQARDCGAQPGSVQSGAAAIRGTSRARGSSVSEAEEAEDEAEEEAEVEEAEEEEEEGVRAARDPASLHKRREKLEEMLVLFCVVVWGLMGDWDSKFPACSADREALGAHGSLRPVPAAGCWDVRAAP
jgi:hypothetical protein